MFHWENYCSEACTLNARVKFFIECCCILLSVGHRWLVGQTFSSSSANINIYFSEQHHLQWSWRSPFPKPSHLLLCNFSSPSVSFHISFWDLHIFYSRCSFNLLQCSSTSPSVTHISSNDSQQLIQWSSTFSSESIHISFCVSHFLQCYSIYFLVFLHISSVSLYISFSVPVLFLQCSSASPSVFLNISSRVSLHLIQCSFAFPSVFLYISFSVLLHLLSICCSNLYIYFSVPPYLFQCFSTSSSVFLSISFSVSLYFLQCSSTSPSVSSTSASVSSTTTSEFLDIFFYVPLHLLQWSSLRVLTIFFSKPTHHFQCSSLSPLVIISSSVPLQLHRYSSTSPTVFHRISFIAPLHLLRYSSISPSTYFSEPSVITHISVSDPQICCNEPLHLLKNLTTTVFCCMTRNIA